MRDQAITTEIWKDKYRYGDEQSIKETLDRVIDGVYANDPNVEAREHARRLIHAQHIVPAGRILAGAGTPKRVTMINCFVGPIIQDSMETEPDLPGKGIMDALKDSALTQQMGGGIGNDYSTVRPNGALVKRTHSVSSGILPFMDMWSAMCGTVKSSGSRRGAMMGTLAIWHPDILEFIVAKQTKDRLKNFNISVLVTDDFMEAVEQDGDWDLRFQVPRADGNHVDQYNGWYVYKRIKARDLWNTIIENTYIHAEPGVIFVDRINKLNNLWYAEKLHCTNPCFSADTLIATNRGAFQIKELAESESPVTIWDGARWVEVDSFRETGRNQPMLKIEMQDGSALRVTPYHEMLLDDGRKAEARYLQIGEKLSLSDVTYDGDIDTQAPYLKGFLLGDGHLRGSDRPQPALHLYGPKWVCRDRLANSAKEITQGDINTNAIRDVGFNEESTEKYTRLNMTGLSPLGHELRPWCSEYKHRLPLEVFRWNRRSKTEFIAGLFDADGSVMDTSNGFGYQVSSIHRSALIDVQTLLKTIGVRSKVSLMKKAEKAKNLPGRVEGYDTQDCWRVSVAQAGSINMASIVNFARLRSLSDKSTAYLCKPRSGKVVSISEDGIDGIVYCCTVPDTHTVALAIGITTSQCGEQPLPPNGDCNLGHVNLAGMVIDPFTLQARFNFGLLSESARAMVRLLDNVLDITQFPTENQREEAMNKRREGIGYTGLATALQQLGIIYGSPKAVDFTRLIGRTLRDAVYWSSVDLAKERGPFPLFDADKYCQSEFFKTLPSDLQLAISQIGIRNALLLTIAPTGTTSILMGNVSSGIEPVFLHKYDRKVLTSDGISFETHPVYDYGYLKYQQSAGVNEADTLPDYFVTAGDLTVKQHLEMQAAAQEFIDSSISKTINCPTEMKFEEFKDVYLLAYKMGLKGCTTYRYDPRSARGEVLSAPKEDTTNADNTQKSVNADIPATHTHTKAPMQDVLEGRRYRIKWPSDDNAYYLNINDYVDPNGVRRPFECFVSTKSVMHQPWISALTRTISAIFRREDNIAFLADELQQVHAVQGGGVFYKQKYVPSLVAMIGIKIDEHLRWLGLTNEEQLSVNHQIADNTTEPIGSICDRCGAPAMVMEEGCRKCKSCGHSHCG